MTAPMDQPTAPEGPVSRKEARRLLKQVTVGVGAMLLAAVDDWNALSARHSAHLRTVMQGLGRGAYVAAAVAAGNDVWLSTHGMHPPGHTVVKPYRWPEISSRGKTHMMIHHNEMEPTTPRRTAFFTQDSATLGLVGDPTHCELTWDYDIVTDTHIRRIWVSAPGVDWDRFEVPMAKVQVQYATWRNRDMKWLPGALPTDTAAAEPMPSREPQEDLRPDIQVRRPRRPEEPRDAE